METLSALPVTRKSAGHLTILAVADEVSAALYDYFEPSRWRTIDLILSCGDLPPTYLDFLASSLDVPLFYVRGNHDGKYRQSEYPGGGNLHGRVLTCQGIRLAGFEGSPRYNNREYQYSDREMRAVVIRSRLKALRGGPPDIVLTHSPPFQCHDAPDACHRGFQSFRGLIDAWQPAIFIHGHMHNYERSERETMIGRTRVINVFPYTVLQVPLPNRDALAS